MKKIRILSIIAACLLLIMQSCNKQELKSAGGGPASAKNNNNVSVPITGVVPSGKIYYFVTRVTVTTSPNKVMGSVEGRALEGTYMEQKPYVENKGQDFVVTSLGNGDYKIIHVHSGKALVPAFGQVTANAPVVLADYQNIDAYKWKIEEQGANTMNYRIRCKTNTSLGIHVNSGSTTTGTQFFLKTFVTSGVMLQAGHFQIHEVTYTKTQAKFIGLPDTQSYFKSEIDFPYHWPMFVKQVDWIWDNRANITAVIHQGDITAFNSGADWAKVKSQYYDRLNNHVPYVLAVGNHDMGGLGLAQDRISKINDYFPYSEMWKLPGFGGIFETNKIDNAYYLLETGAYKWLILTLEFGPRDEVLAWANTIVDKFTDRTVILNTHAYMYHDNTTIGAGDASNPKTYPMATLPGNTVNDGDDIWTKLVKVNSNIRFVLSGHILGDGCGTKTNVANDDGHIVYQFLANFQQPVEPVELVQYGGWAYMRRMTIDFPAKILVVETNSPATSPSRPLNSTANPFFPTGELGFYPDATGRDHNLIYSNINLVGM